MNVLFHNAVDYRKKPLVFGLGVGLVLLATVGLAFGSLGGQASSVQADALHAQGKLRSIPARAYSLHEIDTAKGILLREYVSPAGRVFAVTWQGAWMPDMRQLLGSYFDQYEQAAQQHQQAHPGRHPLAIQTPGLVLTLDGHPGWFIGKAYIPDLVPQGVHAEELK